MLNHGENGREIIDLIGNLRALRIDLAHRTQLREYNSLRIETLKRKLADTEARFLLEAHQQRDPHGNPTYPTVDLQRAALVTRLARDRSTLKRIKLLDTRRRMNIKQYREKQELSAEIENAENILTYKLKEEDIHAIP